MAHCANPADSLYGFSRAGLSYPHFASKPDRNIDAHGARRLVLALRRLTISVLYVMLTEQDKRCTPRARSRRRGLSKIEADFTPENTAIRCCCWTILLPRTPKILIAKRKHSILTFPRRRHGNPPLPLTTLTAIAFYSSSSTFI